MVTESQLCAQPECVAETKLFEESELSSVQARVRFTVPLTPCVLAAYLVQHVVVVFSLYALSTNCAASFAVVLAS